MERRLLPQPSPVSPDNNAQKALVGRSLTISSDVELTAYVPGAISWVRGYNMKVWDDLRKGMSREGEDGKEEGQIEFHLAILLAKRA